MKLRFPFSNTPGKSPSSFETDIHETISELKECKNEVIGYTIISFIGSLFISGFLQQYIVHIFNSRNKIIILKSFKLGLAPWGGLLLSLFFWITLLYGALRIFKQFHHNYETDPDGDHQVSKSGVYGRAHWQREEERKECFIRSKDPYEIMGDILGKDENGLLYSVSGNIKGLNKNMAIIGASGAGKSEAMVKPMIYQNIIRGSSMIVTDSKGDLYKDTAEIAIKHGYIMRVLNLKSSEIKNSDGVDLLKILKDAEDSDAKAEVMANVIIENSGDGHMDYFAVNETNLLKALLLLVTTQQDYIKAGKDNLAEVYNLCSHNTPETLAARFNMLDEDDPAKEAFSIYWQCEPKVRGQILNGMAIRLTKLSNKFLKEVVKNDEIDMLLPMKRKCIYYVVISDMDRAYKFIATLFFSELFIRLAEYADGMTDEERKKRIPVNFILDEYANTGAIPDMDQKVSTIRSRDITTTIILQDIGQLENMYPKLWETILNNMSIKILLATNDEKTAVWFSKKLGTKTVRVENRGYQQDAGDIIQAPGNFRVSEGLGKRPLMSPDELQNELSENDLVIIISKRFPIKLKKYLAFEHPMDKEKEGKVRIAKKHLPKWRKRILDREREIAEKQRLAAEEEKRRIEEADRKREAERKRQEEEKRQRELEEREIEKAIKEREELEKAKKNTSADSNMIPAEDIPEISMELEADDIPEIELPYNNTDTFKDSSKETTSTESSNKRESKGWVSKWAMDVDDEEDGEKDETQESTNVDNENSESEEYVIADKPLARKNDIKKQKEKEKEEEEKNKILDRDNAADNAVTGIFD